MKLLFENWRGYLEEDQYLDENDYLIEEDYIDEQSIFGDDDAAKAATAGRALAAGVEQAEPTWLDTAFSTADTAFKANPGYAIRDKLGDWASDAYDAGKGWLSDQFPDEPKELPRRPMSQRPHATVPKGALHMPDVQLQMPDMLRSDYLTDRPFGYKEPGSEDPYFGGLGADTATGNIDWKNPDTAAAAEAMGYTRPQPKPQPAPEVDGLPTTTDPKVLKDLKDMSDQAEIDQLKGFGSKFRKARELGMTKFKHKGKTFGTRLAKKRSKPGPADGLAPGNIDPKMATKLKALGNAAERRVGAEDARARERAIARQLGPGGVMGVAQNTRIPPMNENRRPSRRRPSKRLKMRVNRLTKTTK
tara:strand:- start:465 stop:1544 length:1080 start_codon:yes stop_codon:yes gene_type:complete